MPTVVVLIAAILEAPPPDADMTMPLATAATRGGDRLSAPAPVIAIPARSWRS